MEKSTFLCRVVPGSLLGRVILFFFLPLLLLSTTIWAILLEPRPLSPYLCGLLLFGTVMAVRYRVKGFLISVAAVAAAYFFKRESWQFFEIGLCAASIFDFLVVLLSLDEIRASLSVLVNESKKHMNQYLAKNQELLETEENFCKAKETLEEEIASWKEQAEQRKIDLRLAEEKMQLVQSEIEMLTSQKQSIIEQAYAERKEAKHQLALLKEQMAEVERAREEVHRRMELVAQLEEEKLEEHVALIDKQELEKARASLIEVQGELEQLQQQKRTLQEELQRARAAEQMHAAQKNALQQELENMRTAEMSTTTSEESVQVSANERQDSDGPAEVARVQGLYNQLRTQFEEKSRTLVRTRKDLFAAETKLQAEALEHKLAELSPEREEIVQLQKDLDRACLECEALEIEVNSLEELISHILSQ